MIDEHFFLFQVQWNKKDIFLLFKVHQNSRNEVLLADFLEHEINQFKVIEKHTLFVFTFWFVYASSTSFVFIW